MAGNCYKLKTIIVLNVSKKLISNANIYFAFKSKIIIVR